MDQLHRMPYHDQPAPGAGWRMRPAARRRRLERLRLARALAYIDAYIDAHLDDRLDAGALARHCGLDLHRFVRVFGAFVGIPPQRYVAYKRLERAHRLLLAHALALPEIRPAPPFAPFASEADLAAAAVRAAAAGIGQADAG